MAGAPFFLDVAKLLTKAVYDPNDDGSIAKAQLDNLDIVNADVNTAAGIVKSKIDRPIVGGGYTGNDVANRPIAHGLGKLPLLVYIVGDTNNHHATEMRSGSPIRGWSASLGSAAALAVSAFTTTNFYVGNATSYAYTMNVSGRNYEWIAIG